MRTIRRTLNVLLGVMLLLGVAACGGATAPATIDDVPVYPDATNIPRGENELVDQLIDGISQAVNEEDVSAIESQVYALPADTTWEQVKSFYSDKLGEAWQADDELTDESTEIKVKGWVQDTDEGEQALVLYYTPSLLLGDDPHLIIALVTE